MRDIEDARQAQLSIVNGYIIVADHFRELRRRFNREFLKEMRREFDGRSHSIAPRKREQQKPLLTNRELDVCRCSAQGKRQDAMVLELGISAQTVKDHVESLYRKLGSKTPFQAGVQAARLGLVD